MLANLPPAVAVTQPFEPPFFRLTEAELHLLRRRAHCGPNHRFSDWKIACELSNLGRGWDGFVRTRNQATQEGKLAEFDQRLKAELDQNAQLGTSECDRSKQQPAGVLSSGNTRLPNGAISIATAKEAAGKTQQSSPASSSQKKPRPKNTNPTPIADPRDPRFINKNKLKVLAKKAIHRQTDNAEYHANPSHSKLSSELSGDASDTETKSNSSPKSGTNSHTQKTYLPPSPIGRRSGRNKTRPDYRIRSISEAERESEHGIQRDPSSAVSQPACSQPSRLTSPMTRDVYSQLPAPKFFSFRCKWNGCRAELINLAKLRKHMTVVHANEACTKLQCKWGECGRSDEEDFADPVLFVTIEELETHVESQHMTSVMWRLGDGPKNDLVVDLTSKAPDCPDYLFWNGVQITPSVKEQEIMSAAEERARQKRLKKALEDAAKRLEDSSSELDDDDDDEDDEEEDDENFPMII